MQTERIATMKVVEVFGGNFGVEDNGKLVVSGFRTWADAWDWIGRNTPERRCK